MTRPLAVDLCCGLGGWTEGLLAEKWDVVGFDVEQHIYGEHRYPAQLVLQDILTLDGRQFRGKASLIVASPPCQKYSYMAMPWTRAKALAVWYRDPEHPERLVELTALFDACHRIAREAECPIVVENVRGAQPWVGRAQWHYGSYYLWGDVPALMPMPSGRQVMKDGVAHRTNGETNFHGSAARALGDGVKAGDRNKGRAAGSHKWTADFQEAGIKNTGGSWFAVAHNTTSGKSNDARDAMIAAEGVKQAGISGPRANGKGDRWFQDGAAASGSKSTARKAASARIAKIPFALARHIAYVHRPASSDASHETAA